MILKLLIVACIINIMGSVITQDKSYSYTPQFFADSVAEGNTVTTEQLSPNFKLKEFNQKQNPLPLEQIKVNPLLVEKLEVLRSLIGNKPIIVTSGYRTTDYNKKIGGATKSQHMYGNAADIKVKGIGAERLKKFAEEAGFPFVMTYKDKPHLHVDVRGLKKEEIDWETAARVTGSIQNWWKQMQQQDPSLRKVDIIDYMKNDPSGYDYAKAIKMGILPQPTEHAVGQGNFEGQYRWISDNPELWKRKKSLK